MKNIKEVSFLICVSLLLLAGCKSEYEKLVVDELAKGVRNDSIFLGIKLGMTSKEFYSQCWRLNRQRIVRQGVRNTSVLYEVKELKDSAWMNFYPEFKDDKVFEMPVNIAYKGWSPWNKYLSTDSLILDAVKMCNKWYGGDFILVDFPDKGKVYVKMDGNRRILLFKENESSITMLVTDMSIIKDKAAEK